MSWPAAFEDKPEPKKSPFSSKQNPDDIRITRICEVKQDDSYLTGQMVFLFESTDSNNEPTATHKLIKPINKDLELMPDNERDALMKIINESPKVFWKEINKARVIYTEYLEKYECYNPEEKDDTGNTVQ